MHRIAARLAILLVLMHFVAVLIDPGYVPFQLIRDPIGDYKIVFAYGFFAFMLMLLVFVTSLPQIRRRFFEVFYYIHHVFIAIWVLAILHNSSALHQAILIVPFALWGLDRLVRCYRGRVRSHKLIKSQIIADALRLEFQGPITSCCPPVQTESGSYAFINCPAVSWLQWHPFSISSRADAEHFTFHIKNMGAGTFTKALHEHFEKNPNAKVYVDGPYGHCAVRFEEYSSIVLVAGGVGVTPMAAILDDLYEKCKSGKKPPRLENVIFCWSVQAKETIQWMDDLVKKIQASPEPVTGCRFDVQVFVTREKQDSAFYKAGRPKYEAIFDAAERPKDGAGKEWNIGVLACGPEPMVCDVQKLSQIRKVDFHKEIFAF
jgi:predicted ferric reductase